MSLLKKLSLAIVLNVVTLLATAQVITSEPDLPTAGQPVTIFFDFAVRYFSS